MYSLDLTNIFLRKHNQEIRFYSLHLYIELLSWARLYSRDCIIEERSPCTHRVCLSVGREDRQ